MGERLANWVLAIVISLTLVAARPVFSQQADPAQPFRLDLPISGKTTHRDVVDPLWGAGSEDEITAADGGGVVVQRFASLPFVLVKLTLHNGTASATTQNVVPIASCELTDATPVEQLKVRGTGGLLPLSKAGGSYQYIAVADENGKGIVAGFISSERATGVLEPSVDGGSAKISARCEYGRLKLDAGATTTSELLAIGHFDDCRLGLEAWADAVARYNHVDLQHQPVGYCTWYSDKHGGAGDQASTAELASFCQKNLAPWGFDFIQIDDGWQMGNGKGNGSNKNFTAANTRGPYKSGMKATADAITSRGLTPGLWLMPFAGTHNDPYWADKQNLFVRRDDGSPYDTAWGGTCLDMTNPDARAYVAREIHQIVSDWGYTYLKLDGFWTGLAAKQIYVNSGYKPDGFGDAVLSDPSQTNVQAMREGIRLVRKTAGDNTFLLGCCVAQNMRSFGASLGLVDAMRIGPDNGGSWHGWSGDSPLFGGRNYFLNGRVWYNDPDPHYIREKTTRVSAGGAKAPHQGGFTDDEARLAASWVAIADQLNTVSDWLPDLPPERIEILRRTMLPHHQAVRPIDFFKNDRPNFWLVSDNGSPRRDILAIFNFSDEPMNVDLAYDAIGLPPADGYVGFEFWSDHFLGRLAGSYRATVSPHTCQIIALRAADNHPILLSTSRHVTQGMIDLADEKWDSATSTLSGKSKLVANDPYELRIWSPPGWKPTSAKVPDGVTADIRPADDGLSRAKLVSPTSGEVAWSITFSR